jgi:hypothetical protein
VIQPDGDLFRGSLTGGLFLKRPPKLHIYDLRGHLPPDLLDRGAFAIDLLADIVPIDLFLPTACLGSCRQVTRAGGLHGRLILVSAPSGFGKTTLLSAWAATGLRPVSWLSLGFMRKI